MTNPVETIQIRDAFHKNGSLDFHVWQDIEGWWSFRSGEGCRGDIFETYDVGPYDCRQEAIDRQSREVGIN